MTRIGNYRHTVRATTASGFEQLVEQLIRVARVEPERVLAEARRRGLHVQGRDLHEQVQSLRHHPATTLDPLARSFVKRGSLAAGLQGFVTNVGGIATLPFALSADTVGTLWWIVRATSGVMTAYGFESETVEGAARLRLGLLAATGVNTVAVEGTRVVVDQVSRQLLANPAAQQAIARGTRRLVGRLAAGSARQRFAKAVPLAGGAVGGALNVAMVELVGRRTRRHYRQLLVDWQWQQSQRGLASLAPPSPRPRALPEHLPHVPPPPPSSGPQALPS